jgi:capsular exopolysaccharide synthesis family protein
MSIVFDALKKAENDKENGSHSREKNSLSKGRHRTPGLHRAARASALEYEKIGAWLTNPALQGRRLQTVMVVAPRSDTGNTTTAALLAETLANVKKRRVLIIDSNFRTPALNMVFQVKNNGGFIEVASDDVPFEAHIQATDRANLFVLTSGRISISPAEVFEGDAIDRLIVKLKEKFDYIVFDAAPVMEFPDSYAIASKVDSIILVARSEKTSIDDAQRAKLHIEQAGGRILGIVLNRQRDYTPSFLRRFL